MKSRAHTLYLALRDRKRARSGLVIARLAASWINERLYAAADYLLLNVNFLNIWQLSILASILLHFGK